VTAILIVINVLVYIAQRRLSYRLITSFLALNTDNVLNGDIWQFITYMFAHGWNMNHLLFNMIALFLFGYQVEREMGSFEFLLYYLVCGILAGVLSFLFYLLTGSNNTLLGASGAIFAVQLAFAVLKPNAIVYIWGILPLRAAVMVLVATAIELISTLTGSDSNVAHLTHLFGFGAGWLYFLVRFGVNPSRYLFRR
jgi:membrane associated rhomboid family serine protease